MIYDPTPVSEVYEAFLAKITADDWTLEEDRTIVERDWFEILQASIFRFKYPRVSLELEIEEEEINFVEHLSNDEIQLLALYMKHEWFKRCIASWDKITDLYGDKQFSVANHLDKLNKAEAAIAIEIKHAEGIYDRSRNKRPAELFRRLAGKKNAIK